MRKYILLIVLLASANMLFGAAASTVKPTAIPTVKPAVKAVPVKTVKPVVSKIKAAVAQATQQAYNKKLADYKARQEAYKKNQEALKAKKEEQLKAVEQKNKDSKMAADDSQKRYEERLNEAKKQAEEQKRKNEQQVQDAKKRTEEQQRQYEQQQKDAKNRTEEQKRQYEQQQQDAKNRTEEQKRQYEQQQQDAKKRTEEQQRQYEQQQKDAQKQLEEQQRESEKKQQENAKKLEEQNKKLAEEAGKIAPVDDNKAKAQEYYKKGLALESQRNYKQAFYAYSEVVKLNAGIYQAYQRLGNCYVSFGNKEQAIVFYKKYLSYNPGDVSTASYLTKLEASHAAGMDKIYAGRNVDEEFKSPFSAHMFSYIDLFPINLLYAGFGNFYSRSRLQTWTPASSSLTIVGGMLITAGAIINGKFENTEKSDYALMSAGAGMMAAGLLTDYVTAPFVATENAELYLNKIKTMELKVEKERVEYKDPALTSVFSLTAGIIPGAGHWWAGDNETALKLLIATPILTGITYGVGMIYNGKAGDDNKKIAQGFMYSAIGVYTVMRCIDLYGSLLHTDNVNSEYYKQLLCPNSPYKVTEKKDEKEPGIAFLIAAGPGLLAHGAGNFYAENYSTAFTLAGVEALGAVLYLANPGTKTGNTTQDFMRYAGIALFGISYLADVASAPGYTAVYNAVYTNRSERIAKENKIGFAPMLDMENVGISLTYNF